MAVLVAADQRTAFITSECLNLIVLLMLLTTAIQLCCMVFFMMEFIVEILI